MKKTNKIMLMLAFLTGALNLGCSPSKQPESSSKPLELEKNIMADIDEMGRNWGSYYAAHTSEERTEQYFEEHIRPRMTYNETKLQFKFCDRIPERNSKALGIIESSEKIPDQLQDLLNYEDIKVNICNPSQENSEFNLQNAGAFYGGREIHVSIHSPSEDVLHEAGHAIDRFTSRCVTSDYKVFFDIFDKYKNSVPEYYKNNEEFFAYIFEKYYDNPEYLKANMPEAHAFLRKFEVLNVERSLIQNSRNRAVERNK